MQTFKTGLTTLALALFVSSPAFAFPKLLKNFSAFYKADGIDVSELTGNESCGTCHVNPAGGGARNGYGKALQTALDDGKDFDAIESLDSDSDKFTNIEEIFLQTAPGRADDKPAGRIAVTLGSKAVLVKPSVACASLELLASGFTFDGGKATLTLSKVDASAATSVPLKGDKGLVLARCAKEGVVGSLSKE